MLSHRMSLSVVLRLIRQVAVVSDWPCVGGQVPPDRVSGGGSTAGIIHCIAIHILTTSEGSSGSGRLSGLTAGLTVGTGTLTSRAVAHTSILHTLAVLNCRADGRPNGVSGVQHTRHTRPRLPHSSTQPSGPHRGGVLVSGHSNVDSWVEAGGCGGASPADALTGSMLTGSSITSAFTLATEDHGGGQGPTDVGEDGPAIAVVGSGLSEDGAGGVGGGGGGVMRMMMMVMRSGGSGGGGGGGLIDDDTVSGMTQGSYVL